MPPQSNQPPTHQAPLFREAVDRRLTTLEQGQQETNSLLKRLLEETEPDPAPAPQNPEPQFSNPSDPPHDPAKPILLAVPPVPSPTEEEQVLAQQEAEREAEAERQRLEIEKAAEKKKSLAGRWW